MILINIKKLTNGMILIGIGLLFLLRNLGIIQWSPFSVLIELWPLIFIVLGINILFKNKMLIVIITWLLFFLAIIAYGFFFENKYQSKNSAVNETFTVTKEEETTEAKMDLNLGAAKIRLDSKTNHLIYASINPKGIKSDITYKNNQKKAVILFDSIQTSGKIVNTSLEDCQFSLNNDVLWEIHSELGVVSGEMDFSSLKVKKLDLDIGAGDLKLLFGDAYDYESDIEISAGASNINLVLPKNAGVKLKLEGLVSKNPLTSLGWEKNGDTYYSPNYQDANSKLSIDIDMGVGRLDVNLQ